MKLHYPRVIARTLMRNNIVTLSLHYHERESALVLGLNIEWCKLCGLLHVNNLAIVGRKPFGETKLSVLLSRCV